MQRYDFTKLGGFPLTQDVLNDMQGQYMTMMQKLCGNFGPGPYIISGMVQAGGSITDGWFYYNGDVIPFTGGVIPTPAGGSVVLVQITIGTGTLLFNDGSSPVVKISPTAALTTGATVTDATHFPLSALQLFGREANWTTAAFGLGSPISGQIVYKKNYISNTLQANITASISHLSIGTGYAGGICNLPSGYRPASTVYFEATLGPTLTFPVDGSGHAVKNAGMSIDNTGLVSIAAPAAGSSDYTVYASIILPLD